MIRPSSALRRVPPAVHRGGGRALARLLLCLGCLLLLQAARSGPAPAAAQGFCTGASCPPPTVTIEPAEGSWAGTAASLQVAVTISWCDAYTLDPATYQVTLDGASVTAGFDYDATAAVAGCESAAALSVGTVTLAPGTHTLAARIRNGSGQWGQATATYTYTQGGTPPASVAVSPDGKAVVRGRGERVAERFTVENRRTVSTAFTLAAACSGSGAAGCSLSRQALTLAPGERATVGVAYTAGAEGTAAAVMLKAWVSDASATRDSGVVQVSVHPATTRWGTTWSRPAPPRWTRAPPASGGRRSRA